MLKLVAMIAQGQRLREATRQGLKPAKILHPFGIAEMVEPNARRPSGVAIAQNMLRKGGRLHHIIKGIAQRGVQRFRLMGQCCFS